MSASHEQLGGASVKDVSQWTVIFRVVIAALLGGAIGLDRHRRRLPAGIRTHMLVASGAALLVGTALLVDQQQNTRDALRVTTAIITGVGFIGAGTIITQNGRMRGLTTAATIWITAAIGIATGFGFIITATIVAIPIALAILSLRFTEDRVDPSAEDD